MPPKKSPWKPPSVAANCQETDHIFAWPSGTKSTNEQRRLWTAFVKTKVANFVWKRSSRLCFKHFTKESFSNYERYVLMPGEKFRFVLQVLSNVS